MPYFNYSIRIDGIFNVEIRKAIEEVPSCVDYLSNDS